jgi:hypothetical protein
MGMMTYGSAALQCSEAGHSKSGTEKMSLLLILTEVEKVL